MPLSRGSRFTSGVLQRKKRKRIYTIIGLGIFTLGSFFWFIFSLARFEPLLISDISVSGTSVLDDAVLIKASKEELSENRFLFFPRRNALLFSRKPLIEKLQEMFPRIQDISVSREGLTHITVLIREHEPFGLWCADDTKGVVEESSSCFFLNQDGYIFAEAPRFSGDAFLRFFVSLPEGEVIRQQVLSPDSMQGVRDFLMALDSIELPPYGVVVDENGDIEILIQGGARILATQGSTLREEFENLSALLASPAFLKRTPLEASLDYIDLRFGNKLFFRFHDE